MSVFKNMGLLELVEAFASHECLPCCEQDVSDRYDSLVEELGLEATLSNDPIMLSEDFSSFVDNLCSDGELHPEQVRKYDYVGKYG